MAEKIPTKPYLIRAIHEWCTDSGFTPYIDVRPGFAARVPEQYIKDGHIVLDISYEATGALKIDNQAVTFKARFGGVSHDIYIPVENVAAIFASENGQGMGFETSEPELPAKKPAEAAKAPEKPAKKPTLTRIK